MVGTFATDFVGLAGLIAGNVPVEDDAHFIIRSDKVARAVDHPNDVVDDLPLLVESFHDSRLVSEALEGNEAHATVGKAHEQVVLEGIPGEVNHSHHGWCNLISFQRCTVLVCIENERF